jgi:hypothetical protein
MLAEGIAPIKLVLENREVMMELDASRLHFFELGRIFASPPCLRTCSIFFLHPRVASSPSSTMESSQSTRQTVLVDSLSSLTAEDSSAATDHPQPLPPHLSHDPENNLKRSDPFQFGSRLLSQEDNVFEFNAWDHVETDDAYKEYAELQYAKQREAPVSDFDKGTHLISSSPAHHRAS